MHNELSRVMQDFDHGRLSRRQMISRMTPNQIIDFDKNNFAIPYEDISEVKVKTGFDRGIMIKTRQGKTHKYGHASKEDLLAFKHTLKRYIGERIK